MSPMQLLPTVAKPVYGQWRTQNIHTHMHMNMESKRHTEFRTQRGVEWGRIRMGALAPVSPTKWASIRTVYTRRMKTDTQNCTKTVQPNHEFETVQNSKLRKTQKWVRQNRQNTNATTTRNTLEKRHKKTNEVNLTLCAINECAHS